MSNLREGDLFFKPDLTVDGIALDDIIARQKEDQKTANLLEAAKKSIITNFSRHVLATGGGSFGGVVGAGVGAGLGAAAGMILTSGFRTVIENIAGISLPSTSPAEIFPQESMDWFTSTLPDIYSSIVSAATGLSLASYTARAGWTEGYTRGDQLGLTIGTKLTLPVLKLHSRLTENVQRNLNLFDA